MYIPSFSRDQHPLPACMLCAEVQVRACLAAVRGTQGSQGKDTRHRLAQELGCAQLRCMQQRSMTI